MKAEPENAGPENVGPENAELPVDHGSTGNSVFEAVAGIEPACTALQTVP